MRQGVVTSQAGRILLAVRLMELNKARLNFLDLMLWPIPVLPARKELDLAFTDNWGIAAKYSLAFLSPIQREVFRNWADYEVLESVRFRRSNNLSSSGRSRRALRRIMPAGTVSQVTIDRHPSALLDYMRLQQHQRTTGRHKIAVGDSMAIIFLSDAIS